MISQRPRSFMLNTAIASVMTHTRVCMAIVVRYPRCENSSSRTKDIVICDP
jgi:hypothetical protein